MPKKRFPDDDQPATRAGAANNPTEAVGQTQEADVAERLEQVAEGRAPDPAAVDEKLIQSHDLPTSSQPAHGAGTQHAWSAGATDDGDEPDDSDEPDAERQPWVVAAGWAGGILGFLVLCAIAAAGLTVVFKDDSPGRAPTEAKTVAAPATSAAVTPSLSTVIITAPQSTVPTTTQTTTPMAATGPVIGSPCSSVEHGKLSAARGTGQEIFCYGDVNGEGQWQATPSDVVGVHIMYSSCDGLPPSHGPRLARSTDGYLITCEPASYADPRGGSWLMWQPYRAIFDPGT